MSLEAPAVGAAAINPMGGDVAPTPHVTPPGGSGRARPSEFNPDVYGGMNNDQPVQSTRDPRGRFVSQNGAPAPEAPPRPGLPTGDPEIEGEGGEEAPEEDYAEPEPTEEQPDEHVELAGRLAEMIKAGKIVLDDALLALPFEFQGQTFTLPEIFKGNMRQADYTRKLKSAEKVRDQGQHIINVERQRTQSWQNPRQMLTDLQRMGLGQAVHQMTLQVADEIVSFRKMSPEDKQQFIERRRFAQERQEFAEQQARWQAEQQAARTPSMDDVTAHFARQLQQAMPQLWKQHQLPEWGEAKKLFVENLETLYPGQGDLSQEMLNDAAIATKEMLDEKVQAVRRRRAEFEQTRRKSMQGMPPKRTGGAPGQQISGSGKQKRPSEFGSKFNSYGI